MSQNPPKQLRNQILPNLTPIKNDFQLSTIKPAETDDEILERLSKLSKLEYERCREQEAEAMGVKRVSMLDKAVQAHKEKHVAHSIIEELEPYPESVVLSEVLSEIEHEILKHAVLPSGASSAISLWIASAFVMNQFRIFPKLIVFSPEKRCGKSTVLDLVESFCPRALYASSISQAAIYRVIEAYQPTLIIDEADTFIANRNDEIVGIINSGHAKNRAFVIRNEGDNHEPKQFSTWAPMVLASIRPLQGTIMDRGVCIELRRKMTTETVQRIPADLKDKNKHFRQKLMRWSNDHKSVIRANQIEPPNSGNDRAIDNWIPLFTLAKMASKEWQNKALSAYQLLTSQEEEKTAPILLLEDIRDIFESNRLERMSSSELVNALIQLEERPWCEWKKGNPMTVNSLAKILSGFKVHSKQHRQREKNTRGYLKSDFEDAFKRYISKT